MSGMWPTRMQEMAGFACASRKIQTKVTADLATRTPELPSYMLGCQTFYVLITDLQVSISKCLSGNRYGTTKNFNNSNKQLSRHTPS